MKILVGVSNFGKIKRAEIATGDFVLFVGENNSGKTYMMQLIYGVLRKLSEVCFDRLADFDVEGKSILLDKAWIQRFEEEANRYLAANKEAIVFDIFHKDIGIDRLYIKLEDIDVSYRLRASDKGQYVITESTDVAVRRMIRQFVTITEQRAGSTLFRQWRMAFHENFDRKRMAAVLVQKIQAVLVGLTDSDNILFLPASRTGLLLMHKYFFAEKEQVVIGAYEELSEEQQVGNAYGLSAPVYDFLQFLLRYTPSEAMTKKNADILHFIDEHLLEGKLTQEGNDIYYTPQNMKERIPLYLSSSLINELAPVVRALTDNRNYQYLLYDEVETCMHPLKQGEMARLLIRLANTGKKMIVSTHSDTMALKLNNLFLLSTEEERFDKLNRLGLEEADMLLSDYVHIYQFRNTEDGTSVAEELLFRKVPQTGYEFELFTKNIDELFKESTVVME